MRLFFLTIFILVSAFIIGINNNVSAEQGRHATSTSAIVINEFVSNPNTGEPEWVELFNMSEQEIDVDGWRIIEGKGSATKIAGVILAGDFIVVETIVGNLNNSGDLIALYNKEDVLIQEFSYGDWINSRSPAPGKNESVARDALDNYYISSLITKGATNIISQSTIDKKTFAQAPVTDYGSDILITEILPNPKGVDNEEEFIELHNKSVSDVSLAGWHLGDESSIVYFFKDGDIIKAGDYLVVKRSKSRLVLNNDKDKIKLFKPNQDDPYIEVLYSDAPEGMSWSLDFEKYLEKYRLPDDDWTWTEKLTPGDENVIIRENRTPVADFNCVEQAKTWENILFDGSDSYDVDNDILSYHWDFGDGVEVYLDYPHHFYRNSGLYTVILSVNDGFATSSLEKKITIYSELPDEKITKKGKIRINEIMPSPSGPDQDGEWIELFNEEVFDIDISGWLLDDIEGGSSPYKFGKNVIIEGGSYLLVERKESGIALNNTGDEVRLFRNDDNLVDLVAYSKAIEDSSYSRNNDGEWFWTELATPGASNIIEIIESNELFDNNNDVEGDFDVKNDFIQTTIIDIDNRNNGDKLIVEGVVSALPGVLGSQYFYISDQEGGKGIQVYNYNKKFPKLQIGDLIVARGELSSVKNEKRLKTKVKEDVVVLEGGHALVPVGINSNDLSFDVMGALVKVSGEVIIKKGSIVGIDDGQGEIEIYIKDNTGIDKKLFQIKDEVSVVGVVTDSASGPRILPRSKDDVEVEKYIKIESDIVSSNKVIEIKAETFTNKAKTLVIMIMFLFLLAGIWHYKYGNKSGIKHEVSEGVSVEHVKIDNV